MTVPFVIRIALWVCQDVFGIVDEHRIELTHVDPGQIFIEPGEHLLEGLNVGSSSGGFGWLPFGLLSVVCFPLGQVIKGSGKNLGRSAASWIACWPRPRRPSSTAALTWSTRCAPRGDQRICLRLFMRALTRWLTVPSAREVEIGLPAR